jgi:hypothetical protein
MSDRFIKDILEELVDALEEKYGSIEGFECRLEHKPNAEGNMEIGHIKKFSISYLQKTVIDIKDLK